MAKTKNATAKRASTRNVRVSENVHRAYIAEEPIDDAEVIELGEEDEIPPNPIEAFLHSIEVDRNLTLHVWVLPSWEINHQIGVKAADRVFVTAFTFSSEEVETYRQRIQNHYPQGGMFSCELRERGVMVKRWEERIATVPGYEPQKQNQNPYLVPPPQVNIRMPENGQPAAPINPLQVVREQLSTMREMVTIVKELQPPAPVVNVGDQQHAPEKAPFEDRLLETVLVKALESGKAPIDKVLEALTGRRNQPAGFMDSVGPVLAEVAKALVPVLSIGIQQYMRTAGAAAGAPPPGQPGPPLEQPAPPQIPSADPAERAWRRVVQRLLEDCFEHVQVRATSALDGVNVSTSAESIVDLLDRFPDQLTQMVEMLLSSEPEQVVEMCAMLQSTPEIAEGVMTLKSSPAALAWLVDLQVETKKILADADDKFPDSLD